MQYRIENHITKCVIDRKDSGIADQNPNGNKGFTVTLDGPAASGKSTTARLVAQRLGWLYLDTGAMYRAIAVKVLKSKIALDDSLSIAQISETVEIQMTHGDEGSRIFIDGDEVTSEIRTPEIDRAVGPVCEVPRVRERLVDLQRQIANGKNIVTEGRDMGTVVFPKADCKFYFVANLEERAKRRLVDLKRQGIEMSIQKLMEEIETRDHRDSQRDISPLTRADGAIEVDTTRLDIDEQVEFVIQTIQEVQVRQVERI